MLPLILRTRKTSYRAFASAALLATLSFPILAAAKSDSSGVSAMSALPQFTDSAVPAFGSREVAVDPPKWASDPSLEQVKLPGHGLAEHPMLLIGEGNNVMSVVNDGKVIWTYATGKGWEFDDIWMLSNGNILFSRMSYAEEITPDKKVVWHLDAPTGTEIHTLQPLGLDKVMLVENGLPPRLMVINKKTGAVEIEHALDAPSLTERKTVHGQFRRVRVTAKGTYLMAFLEMGKVVEYDKNFQVVWSYNIPTPWAAVRLHNGNTLITDERDELTREVNSKGETVWEFKLSDLPPGIALASGSQSCVRLENGNTLFCSRGGAGKGCQLIEITPEKKVVWALYDWKNFGPASAIQVLDEPGRAEIPGDLQR